MAGRSVIVTASGSTTAEPLAASTRNLEVDVATVFTGRGILPAIDAVTNGPSGWTGPGSTRTLSFSDGGTAREHLTDYQPAVRYGYDITNFTNVLRFLVSGARCEWHYRPDGKGGTAIQWQFAFHPLPGRRGIVRVVLAPRWKRYMDEILRRVIIHLGRS